MRTIVASGTMTQLCLSCERTGDMNLRWGCDDDSRLRAFVAEAGFQFKPTPVRDQHDCITNHSNVHAILQV
jgi:hypothetical protein